MSPLSLTLVAALLSCGRVSGDDGGLPDASADTTSSSDVQGADGGVCVAERPTLFEYPTCSTANAVCQQWAQTAAVQEYGFSQCATNPVTGNLYCNDPGCTGECASGQVCASTTPTGQRQCIQACAGL